MNAPIDERFIPISREEWDKHVAEDNERGRVIDELKLAMFGNAEKPETVRLAMMPTMTRLNTYMDGVLMLAKGFLALLAGGAALVGILKGFGWL